MSKSRVGGFCQISDRGISLDVDLVADGERSGDHCTYALTFTPGDGFLMDGPSLIAFNGEIERGIAVEALRWLADRLDGIEAME